MHALLKQRKLPVEFCGEGVIVAVYQWKLPAEFCGDGVTTAVYLINRAPTKSLDT